MQHEDERAPERDLIARSASGDDMAFERLLAEYVAEVWKLAFHLLRDHHEAEEVVQDTFLRVRHGLPRFRGDCPFRSYLLTICRNRCRDVLEKRRRRWEREVSCDGPTFSALGCADDEGVHAEGLANVVASPDPQTQWATRLDLGAAIAALSEDEREAFILVTVMQKTAEEAGTILACPRTTVQTRLGRARAKLAALLEGYR